MLAAQNRESHDCTEGRPGIARISAARSTKLSGIGNKGESRKINSESPIWIATYQCLKLLRHDPGIARFWIARFSIQHRRFSATKFGMLRARNSGPPPGLSRKDRQLPWGFHRCPEVGAPCAGSLNSKPSEDTTCAWDQLPQEGATFGTRKGVTTKDVFSLQASLESRNSLNSLNLCTRKWSGSSIFPHSWGSLESQDSLECLEFERAPFPKDPFFRSRSLCLSLSSRPHYGLLPANLPL